MRKIIAILAASMLVSCSPQAQHLEETEQATVVLKDFPQTIEEKAQYYIHDQLMPSYVMLRDFPSEKLIDWDESTGTETTMWQTFTFMKEEAIRSIEIYAEDLESIQVKINDYVREYKVDTNPMIINFDEVSFSNKLSLKVTTGRLTEVHITSDLLVDEATYQVYKDFERQLEGLCGLDWGDSIHQALETKETVLKSYSKDQLEMLSKLLDINRLRLVDKGIGCPYEIVGKVVALEEEDRYFKMTLEPLIETEQVIIYSDKPFENRTMFTGYCILISKGDVLKFITVD